MIDKSDHIVWAEAVAVFLKHYRTSDEHVIADLICDLGHLAEDFGFDFLSEVKRGIGHWYAEQHLHDGLSYPKPIAELAETSRLRSHMARDSRVLSLSRAHRLKRLRVCGLTPTRRRSPCLCNRLSVPSQFSLTWSVGKCERQRRDTAIQDRTPPLLCDKLVDVRAPLHSTLERGAEPASDVHSDTPEFQIYYDQLLNW